ncbi:hypothetical protein [Anaeromicrobium sediminis]|uniref:Uncharacterized protein n=1 Tax=Anaeromicrobium sediminis TaxID=1478221 RepID=A0A267MLM9_9FIRM|nr:hypothetical protein [Anaeromicrobium sediminis]PAB60337.1 hypothetical protein CCE28_05430 [Anaeromicrobium sediminis]
MIKNYKIIICIIAVISIFVAGCKEKDNAAVDNGTIVDLGNLKGQYSEELETQAKLIVMVSNQSFYMDKVNLSIYIDEKLLVNDTYLVEDQHNYLYYYPVIEDGVHTISVKYDDKVIGEKTVEILDDKPTWVSLNYWQEKDTKGRVEFHISDERILIM